MYLQLQWLNYSYSVVQFNFSHLRLDINEGDDLPSMLSIVKTGQNEPIISFQVFVYAGDGSPEPGGKN